MSPKLDLRDLEPGQMEAVRSALLHPKYEVIPLKNLTDQIPHLPEGAVVSVTAVAASADPEATWVVDAVISAVAEESTLTVSCVSRIRRRRASAERLRSVISMMLARTKSPSSPSIGLRPISRGNSWPSLCSP